MFEPRPIDPTPLKNRRITDRCPWKCERCDAIHESCDDPGVKMMADGRVQRVCWHHIEDLRGNHDGE